MASVPTGISKAYCSRKSHKWHTRSCVKALAPTATCSPSRSCDYRRTRNFEPIFGLVGVTALDRTKDFLSPESDGLQNCLNLIV